MKASYGVLVALVAAATLTSVAAGRPDAAKQRVVITSKILPTGRFELLAPQGGALERDSGRITGVWSQDPARVLMRDGQRIEVHPATWTLVGKRGRLVIRERSEWVSAVRNDSGYPQVGTGTWKVVRGTGQYAGVTGGGRSGHAGLGATWFARHEGLVSRR